MCYDDKDLEDYFRTQLMLQKILPDNELKAHWLPIEDWVEIFPNFYEWLTKNGFKYVEELDHHSPKFKKHD